eukprot:TRINITY_DN2840_c0_g2_i10.p1 TRINITY_DN2840_c0_g2~~TRINITY_DN2840_c0_g2_i10.p1  ORF type:complete len:345 (+),score=53.46 TRINITY_DN2840_c0_g2_i10:55-1035(+)
MDPEEAKTHLSNLYGLDSTKIQLTSLPSYDDQNFRVTTANGTEEYILKISESWATEILEGQTLVMSFLVSHSVLCPLPIPSKNKKLIEDIGKGRLLRLLTYLPGIPYADCPNGSTECLESIGELAGTMDRLLQDFDHPGTHRKDFIWDLRNSSGIRDYVGCLQLENKVMVCQVLDHFETIKPALDHLRMSVIHGDINDYNLLVDDGRVSGVIDFGDCCYSNTICDLAILMAYICLYHTEKLTVACCLLRGYNRIYPVPNEELEVLYPLLCCRLAMSATFSTHFSAQNPDNSYISISQKRAWESLRELWTNVTPSQAFNIFKECLGR